MNDWVLQYNQYEPDHERLREALCTLGNGYFACRGAAAEAKYDEYHYPATYLAGGYNRLTTRIAGHAIENESLVRLPNWLLLELRPEGGEWLSARNAYVYHQRLAMDSGLLVREMHFRIGDGVLRYQERRFVHIDEPHLAAQEVTLTAENWSGQVEVVAAIEGRVRNEGVLRYRGLANKHLTYLEQVADAEGGLFLQVRTTDSRLEVAQAARLILSVDGKALPGKATAHTENGYARVSFSAHLESGQALRIEKITALYSSRDRAIYTPALEARKAVRRCPGFDASFATHQRLWRQLWKHFDIGLEFASGNSGNDAQCILRLHLFHTIQTASLNSMDLDVGVPARGFHGEAYRGHIFWDELFVFPILNLRLPELTHSLLRYRYRRLPEARANARAAGFRGAMYPWQSGSNGREESQRLHLNPRSGRWGPDHSHLQHHVGIAIAYNIWQYYQVTRDLEFLSFYGAEMFLEIARFWASIAQWNPARERFEIRGVMGPDEYHEAYPGADRPGIDNNAYTNIMAAWILASAPELLSRLPTERCAEVHETLKLGKDELTHWDNVSRKLFVPFHGDGIVSQFEGYEQLEPFDWEGYRKKYGNIQRLDRILKAEGDTPNRYQASKQADVLMLFYLLSREELEELFTRLGVHFDANMLRRNIDYYLHRTSHGSTLSRVVHGWVLAREDRPRSWHLFNEALQSDISDVQGGTTPEGIHLGAMAGTVDMVQRCYTGLVTREDVLWLNPTLPREVASIRLSLRYRGHYLDLKISREGVEIHSGPSRAAPISVGVEGRMEAIRPDERHYFPVQMRR
ncbi:glycoside hydrolase family 65 protein [Thiohalomonas denitrificans]|uniref:Trehalose and maltose hydrolase (Possible phosphorylase) n=1 Tax=Thiohalomonas denitrificans TaxID=415747 RepID=A0A1G5Q3A7_9GAMM|nr:glycosyl hydrolase family 65 protein [Thiohalomonas denitrificans]SCZ56152.1 Trehalose and maltose hydrolase (possible phosphorylase) [Thiohalomonas denitrificans]